MGIFETIIAFIGNFLAIILNFIYQFVGNYGVAIIIFTILVRLCMLPSAISQQKGAAKTTRMQRKVKRIQEKYANDKQKMNEEIQNLYASEGYNPLSSGCMPLLIQMPILLGLINVIYSPLLYIAKIPQEVITKCTGLLQEMGIAIGNAGRGVDMAIINNYDKLLDKVPELSAVNFEQLKDSFNFFGLDLTLSPSFGEFSIIWIIPVLSGLSSFLMSYITTAHQKKMTGMSNPAMGGCMLIFMPLMSLWFAFQVPAGVGFYWFASGMVSILQQLLIYKFFSPKKVLAELMVTETIERRSKEEFNKNKGKK